MESNRLKNIKDYIVGIGIFLIVTLAFYLFLFYEYTPVFGINDDWTVYMVLSGSYLGEPDPYVLFFLYPLAWIICKLYTLTNAIPWYGLLLQGCFILSGFWIFIRFYTKCKKNKYLLSIASLLLFYFSNLRILTTIQYTHAAAVCGASAIFCFITAETKNADWKEYLKANVPTIIMAALALCIRKNAAFMCLPVAGMLFLAKCFWEDKNINLKVIKKYLAFCVVLCSVLGGLLLSQEIAYSSDLWSEYADINYYREKVVDFYGTPTYEEMADIAENIGITEEEYNLRENILPFYTADISYSEFLKIMMERSKEKYDLKHPFAIKLKEANNNMVNSIFDKDIGPQNHIVLIMFITVIIWMICNKSWREFSFILCYLFGHFFAWYYILFNGRFPIRIPQCLFVVDFLALLGIYLYLNKEEICEKNVEKFMQIFGAGVLACLVSICVIGSKEVKKNEEYISIFQDRWYGVKEYCMQQPENLYALNGGSQTLYYFSDDVFDTNTIGKPQNYYSISNYYSMSPNCFKKLGISGGEDMAEEILEMGNHYWIYEKGCFSEEALFLKYYKNKYDTFKCELVDVFDTETTTFEVYYLSK